MKIPIPDYLLESVLRHYETLAKAYSYNGDDRAGNAKRVATREIHKVRSIIQKHKNNGISYHNNPSTKEAD